MSAETETTQPPLAPQRGRPSPALLIFLIFPVLGLVAAGIVIMTNAASLPGAAPPTPLPVTLPPPKAVANSPVIDFTLTSLDGKRVSLSDYAGRIVFLNFWATWCTPCQKELPAFQAFQAQQSADGPAILAVDVAESADQVNAFLTEFDIHGLNVLLDGDSKVSDSYGIFNLPVTFVIDEKGVVRYPKYGAMTVDDLNAYVEALKAAT
jgi:peroxiredoxin